MSILRSEQGDLFNLFERSILRIESEKAAFFVWRVMIWYRDVVCKPYREKHGEDNS